jgi:hypothetical protein
MTKHSFSETDDPNSMGQRIPVVPLNSEVIKKKTLHLQDKGRKSQAIEGCREGIGRLTSAQ